MSRFRSPVAARGFSLIELLVVLVILGLLGALVGQRFLARADDAKVDTTKTQVKMLKGSLETMRLDIGRFPTNTEGLALLNTPPADEKIKGRWRGPYLSETVPSDPWGNPYQYALPGANGQPFALYSLGADGKRGGEGLDTDIGMLPAQ